MMLTAAGRECAVDCRRSDDAHGREFRGAPRVVFILTCILKIHNGMLCWEASSYLSRSTFQAFGLHVYFERLYSAEIDFTFILRRILPPLMGPTRPTRGPKAPRNGWRGVSVWCGASGRWAESWLLVHVCGLMWFGIGTCFGAMAPFAFPLLLPWLRVLWRRVMQQ